MSTPSLGGEDVAALFVQDGSQLLPTAWAIGPWSPDALHGGAIAALFAAVLDRPGCTVARINLDLLRAVGVRPLRLEVSAVGRGRRVQRSTAVLHDDDGPVAQGTSVYVADAGISLPEGALEPRPFPSAAGTAPPLELAPLPESRSGWVGFENQALALHTEAEGRSLFRGWFRLLVPAIAGQPVTGLQMALAAADYTSGGSAIVLSLKRWSFVSLDLTVNLMREPRSEWVGLEAPKSLLGPTGVGVGTSVLYDAAGVFGHCAQTQFVQAIQRG